MIDLTNISDYRLVRSGNDNNFNELVNALIRDDYVLLEVPTFENGVGYVVSMGRLGKPKQKSKVK